MIPEEQATRKHVSENLVFDALQGLASRPGWTALHSVPLAQVGQRREGESDFFVIAPGLGVVAIEVKGATEVSYDRGAIRMEGVPQGKKDPFLQANHARRAFLQALHDAGLPSNFPVARLVWFPRIGPHKFSYPKDNIQFFQWEIAFANELAKPEVAVENAIRRTHQLDLQSSDQVEEAKRDLLSPDSAQQIIDALLPTFSVKRTRSEELEEQRLQRKTALKGQRDLLDACEENRVIYFDGVAGTGKTFLLKELAVRARHKQQKVLLTCWNELLGDDFEAWRPSDTLLRAGSLNELMLQFAGLARNPENADSIWYERKLPELALARVRAMPDSEKFDLILVDEFQDIASKPNVLAVLRELEKSGAGTQVALSGDRYQQIFSPLDSTSDPFEIAKENWGSVAKITLRTNYRVAEQLHTEMLQYLGLTLDVRNHRLKFPNSSLKVKMIKPEKANVALKEVLSELLERYPAGEIRVLSAFREKSLVHRIVSSPADSANDRWLAQHMKFGQNGQIRWRSIHKFKGLEATAVVITDVGKALEEWASGIGQPVRDVLYVAISRATTECIILQDDDWALPTQQESTAKRVEKLAPPPQTLIPKPQGR